MKHFVFIRHAESQKNVKDITGGQGEPLTVEGIAEANHIIEYLSDVLKNQSQIVCITSNTKQTIQTAQIISKHFGINVVITDAFKPIGLGCLDGLTTEEIKDKYPNYYSILCAWREKSIDVTKLSIEGIEEPTGPWNRVLNYLEELDDNNSYVIVCTRSIMVLLFNFVNDNKPLSGKYCHQDIKNCGIIAFDYSNRNGISNTLIDI